MQNAGNHNLTVDTALRVITSSMRGHLMTTLAGGTREPRAWKLASVVRGGAVGKGLCYSTSLAAYSTMDGPSWTCSGSVSSTPPEQAWDVSRVV